MPTECVHQRFTSLLSALPLLFTSRSSPNTIMSSNEINHYFYHSDCLWTQNFVNRQRCVESHIRHDVHDGHQGAGNGDSTGKVPDRVLELLNDEVEIIPAKKQDTIFAAFVQLRLLCHFAGDTGTTQVDLYIQINMTYKNLTKICVSDF